MTTAPKLEPEAMRAVALDRARRFLADWDSVSHVAGLAEPIHIILSRVLLHAADEIERLRAAPSAGLREALEFVRKVANARHYASTEAGQIEFNALVKEARALTLSKERGEVASHHQTGERDE